MDDDRLAPLELKHQQLIDRLAHLERTFKPKKDIWDIISAATPLISGLLISGIGLYFAYSNNEAQLKLQETQTIERFFPHLNGTEKEKKAAILAISSLTNTETAAKYADLFPSEGTASALKTIANSCSVKDYDKDVANKALASTFHKIADNYQASQNTTEAANAYQQSIDAQEKLVGINSPALVKNLEQLVEAYKSDHKYPLAESTLKRILKIQKNNSGSRSSEFIGTLNKLATVFKLEGKSDAADHVVDYANLLAQQKATDAAQATNSSTPMPKEVSSTAGDATQNPPMAGLPAASTASPVEQIIPSQDLIENQPKALSNKTETEPAVSSQKSASSLPGNTNM